MLSQWPDNKKLPPTQFKSCGSIFMRQWVRTRNSFHTGHWRTQDRKRFGSMESKGESLPASGGAWSESLQGSPWANFHKDLWTLASYVWWLHYFRCDLPEDLWLFYRNCRHLKVIMTYFSIFSHVEFGVYFGPNLWRTSAPLGLITWWFRKGSEKIIQAWCTYESFLKMSWEPPRKQLLT